MKKLFSTILFLSLLFGGSVFADILLTQCTGVDKNNNAREISENVRHEYFIDFNEGKVYFTYLGDRSLTDFLNKKREDVGLKSQSRTTNKIYYITYFDPKILTAELNETDELGSSIKREIEIDFKSNRISRYVYGINEFGKRVAEAYKNVNQSIQNRDFSLLQCVNENLETPGDTSSSSGTAFFVSNRGHSIN